MVRKIFKTKYISSYYFLLIYPPPHSASVPFFPLNIHGFMPMVDLRDISLELFFIEIEYPKLVAQHYNLNSEWHDGKTIA